ncbi:hypothetical protein AFE_1061 [Acidithiobacillus ferrooxidans ATCC 23270]|uniref:Uncharacterized protein n=1 Tax=Acidithiobacillus ferrooxidans (strain ATCC 23270 / DSM 14882 / CIP 104768 / NCIMB 8455) TaxID=243159 RepID=B7J810_ACIF2|nr:hypothetical protein AFE_1061 [Acidithiobacillus ferrooxidans ATCC 23270]
MHESFHPKRGGALIMPVAFAFDLPGWANLDLAMSMITTRELGLPLSSIWRACHRYSGNSDQNQCTQRFPQHGFSFLSVNCRPIFGPPELSGLPVMAGTSKISGWSGWRFFTRHCIRRLGY